MSQIINSAAVGLLVAAMVMGPDYIRYRRHLAENHAITAEYARRSAESMRQICVIYMDWTRIKERDSFWAPYNRPTGMEEHCT